jgi:hypothetical protein
MILPLFAAIFTGLGAAGLALAVPRLFGRRAPKWLAPVAAGAAIFAFTLWNEYSWFERTAGALPDGVEVAATYTSSSLLQPWTLVVPRINRFAAVDRAGARRNPELPDLMLADVLLFARFEPLRRLPHLFDCAGGRRAEVTPETSFAEDGAPVDPGWIDAGTDDPLVAAACRGAD